MRLPDLRFLWPRHERRKKSKYVFNNAKALLDGVLSLSTYAALNSRTFSLAQRSSKKLREKCQWTSAGGTTNQGPIFRTFFPGKIPRKIPRKIFPQKMLGKISIFRGKMF
jgi:hypothetical protein